MNHEIDETRALFREELKAVSSRVQMEQLRVRFLGKKGILQSFLERLRSLEVQQKKEVGAQINLLKEEIEHTCQKGLLAFVQAEEAEKMSADRVDVTLPGRPVRLGRAHPLYALEAEIEEWLASQGFVRFDGPEIDTDFYNFEGLNFPPDHPARDMQDTFYLEKGFLLRTHTSNLQLRLFENFTPPIRAFLPGTVYRNEEVNRRSHCFFRQFEVVCVDQNLGLPHLFFLLEGLLRHVFGAQAEVRFRPSYFPFVEPGVEVDVSCTLCQKAGCHLCKGVGWLEVAGAGMIHPNVLRNGGLDPQKYSGFALGAGLDRLTMLRHQISDLRLLSYNFLPNSFS